MRFSDLPVGGPYELQMYENAEPTPSVVLGDVLVGDVWLLSGQSNMVLRGPREGDAELYPLVRAITTVQWGQRPSGAAFYFGAQLQDALGIPIGLINRAQGDTALGHWLPIETADDADPVVQSLFTGCGGDLINRCLYYDQHIRPLERPREAGEDREGIALRGVVWWQGEKGEDKRAPGEYAHLFPAMMRAWRSNLGQPGLPFVYHQLPSGTGLRWSDARVRPLPRDNRLDHWQARQRRMYFRMLAFPSTSLMSSIDLTSGIHPEQFDLYGRRLGDAALGTTYVAAAEVTPYVYSGPIYQSATLEPSLAGPAEVRITFRDHTAEGLMVGPDTDPPTTVLQGFAVCCNAEGEYVFADARIENGNEVVVSHAAVPAPPRCITPSGATRDGRTCSTQSSEVPRRFQPSLRAVSGSGSRFGRLLGTGRVRRRPVMGMRYDRQRAQAGERIPAGRNVSSVFSMTASSCPARIFVWASMRCSG